VLGLQVQRGLESSLLTFERFFTFASKSSPPNKNSIGSFNSSSGWPCASCRTHVNVTTQGAAICISR